MDDPAKSKTHPAAPLPVQERKPSDLLKQARQKKNLSLEDAAKALHLRQAQVRSLEEGNFSAWQARTYARGHLRNYAKFLGLDPQEVLRAYEEDIGAPAPTPDIHVETLGLPLRPKRRLSLWVVGGGLLLLLFFSIWVFVLPHYFPSPSRIFPDEKKKLNLQVPIPPESQGELFLPPLLAMRPWHPLGFLLEPRPPAKKGERLDQTLLPILELVFSGRSWVQLKDPAGKVFLSKTFSSGDKLHQVLPQGGTLTLGTAQNVSGTWRGEPVTQGKTGFLRLKLP